MAAIWSKDADIIQTRFAGFQSNHILDHGRIMVRHGVEETGFNHIVHMQASVCRLMMSCWRCSDKTSKEENVMPNSTVTDRIATSLSRSLERGNAKIRF